MACSGGCSPKGPDTVHLLDAGGPELAYSLPEFGIRMPFRPTDFTQVNPHINAALVGRALRLLGVQPQERVIDWFCGLGNFTLPLATQAREVLGIEGSEALVQRSRENARVNGLAHKTSFVARNLFEMTPAQLALDGSAERWLIDPPGKEPLPWPRPWLTPCRTPARHWLDAAAAHGLRQLQSGHAGPRCRIAGQPGGLPLQRRQAR